MIKGQSNDIVGITFRRVFFFPAGER